MGGLVATRGPAGPPGNIGGMFAASDFQTSVNGLLLEVALETKRMVGRPEHLGIHRPMVGVAGHAPFTNSFMLKYEGPLLRRMALQTGVIGTGQLGSTRDDRIAPVRVVAIRTRHLAGQDRMGIRQVKFSMFVQMTLETGLRGPPGIDDGADLPEGCQMHAARTVAALTPDELGGIALVLEKRVGRRVKKLSLIGMAGGAGARSDKHGSGDLRRSHHGTAGGGAGDEEQDPDSETSPDDSLPDQ